jgi:hypothetical protein
MEPLTMVTFADLDHYIHGIRALYDAWQQRRRKLHEDHADYQAFRRYLIAGGHADPGEREVDDFVSVSYKAGHPTQYRHVNNLWVQIQAPTPIERAKLVSEHYQKTFEFTYQAWELRNKTFLTFIGAIAVAVLFVFDTDTTRALALTAIAKITTADTDTLKMSVAYKLLENLLSIVVFYLMMMLYHRTRYVARASVYLKHLEEEIRRSLGIEGTSLVFARESTFYARGYSLPMKPSKYVYVVVIFFLVAAFEFGPYFVEYLGVSPYHELIVMIQQGRLPRLGISSIPTLFDIVVRVAILGYFLAYATTSLSDGGDE